MYFYCYTFKKVQFLILDTSQTPNPLQTLGFFKKFIVKSQVYQVKFLVFYSLYCISLQLKVRYNGSGQQAYF